MNHFHYRRNVLYAENVNVAKIAAEFGTPCFIYSRATLERHYHVFDRALKDHEHLICYAVKANSNIGILNILARLGSGFDVVSGGELTRVIAAKGDPKKVVFSGVGKTSEEMSYALDLGILCFNVESIPELERLNKIAKKKKKIAPISIRVNPNIDPKTHPYIATGLKENKFGIDYQDAIDAYTRAAKLSNLRIKGVDCHIGSQITELQPFVAATDRMLELIKKLQNKGIKIEHIDLGGGLGVPYHDETPPDPFKYVSRISEHIKGLKVIVEPGRVIVANAGILVTKVEYVKHTANKNFVIVDAAMNDLIRPVLYDAWHNIIPVVRNSKMRKKTYDVVGPICETSDFLAKNRTLAVDENDLLAVLSAGAYGFSMSSNYNSRPRAPEVIVDGEKAYLIRERETIRDLFKSEYLLSK